MAAQKLASFLEAALPEKVMVTCTEHGNVKSTKMSGAFEVRANGILVHSKLTGKGHAKCESALERQRVVGKIKKVMTASR